MNASKAPDKAPEQPPASGNAAPPPDIRPAAEPVTGSDTGPDTRPARAQALRAFSALANGDRLDLIRLLVPAGRDGVAAGEIARSLGLSASRLSFHLAQLEQAGLLSARRVARNVFYAVDPAGVGAAISHLLNDCCGEHPEVIACCQGGARRLPGPPGAPDPLSDREA